MTLFNVELTFEVVLMGVFVLTLLVQLFYFLFFFVRLTFFKSKEGEVTFPPVTVIIAARNEERNLVANLPEIFKQDYPEFQVVVVNDRSWDETGDVLRAFQLKYDNLHVVNIREMENYSHGKKLAVTLGIKGAKYENLLFTDADCRPASDQWIKKMVASSNGYQRQKESLILGYSPYKKKKGMLNKLIRFDTVNIGVQYLSFALAGIPYMGVGRNMSYRKELFFSVGGFKSHYHLASGDDDLFVNEVSKKSDVDIVFEPDAQMVSTPEENFTKWWSQK
ncbi:MAG: glycosyltransferase, partial [Flavobacteriales bacterium]|nr:glycosyltransferase [Flavobacteriales bacterium]